MIKKENKNIKNSTKNTSIKIIIIAIILVSLLSLFTKYYGSSDIGDYTDTAKFFSGDLNAKLRTSHPVTYGLLHSPFVFLTKSFISFKITTLLWLSLLILSIYYISGKNQKTLWLFVTTPAFWFMAPWMNPVPLAALLFLWTYYFINKYDQELKLKYLIYSGLLIGITWVFWEAIVYFAFVLAIVFLYNKKTSHSLLFLLMILIGVFPKFIIDYIVFRFPFYSLFKHFFSVIAFSFYGGIYGQTETRNFFHVIPILLMIPVYTLILFTKKNFKKYKRQIIFILISIFMAWIAGTQVRYIFITIPIIILILGEVLNNKQFKVQIIIFLVLTILVINPYIIQIKYETNAYEYPLIITKLFNLELKEKFTSDLILGDLNQIAKNFPNQTFIVGNQPDTYQTLADVYWGLEIKEFVSLQDYNLFLNNEKILFEKSICSKSQSWNRRDICISASLIKPESDNTEYNSIKYALTIGEDIDLDSFQLIKQYQKLNLFEKI